MKLFTLISASILSTIIVSGVVSAGPNIIRLSIKDALASESAQKTLDGSVKFHFANGGGGASAIARKRTSRGNTSEESCQRSFIAALESFQENGKKHGASTVNNLVSYYDRKVFASKSQYECYIGDNGGTGGYVILKGNYAR